MTLPGFLIRHRSRVARELTAATAFSTLYPGTPWSRDVELRYRSMEGGKMLRGMLVLIGYGATGRRMSPAAYGLAATVELAHEALLIHDDVMDRDLLRRGGPSVLAHYLERTGEEGAHDAGSLAVCAGDVGLLHAARRLAALSSRSPEAARASDAVLAALTYTGFGQMEDVALCNGIQKASESAITRMLTDKTARYSCAMPLAAGALLGGGPGSLVDGLEQIGEDLGFAFQLRDDELGLFGATETIGKPAGSDVREGKLTLHAFYLLRAASGDERKRLETIFGNPDLTAADLALVRQLTVDYGAQAKVARIIAARQRRAQAAIASLGIPARYASLLQEVLAFVTGRAS